MRNGAAIIVAAACLAGCWQAAGITLKELPVRDGSEEMEEAEADTAEGDDDTQDGDLNDVVPDFQVDDIFMDDPVIDEIPAGMSPEAYCMGLHDAWCLFVESCCGGQEPSEILPFIDCNDPIASPYYTDCLDKNAASIASGRIVIDEAGFYETCQPSLTSSSGDCPGLGFFTQLFGELFETYCADIIDGRVAKEGHCSSWLECEENLCCSSGICMECAGDGIECMGNDQCERGLRCIDQSCVSPGGPGGSCDAEDDLVLSDCMAGTWCSGDSCSALLAPGQPCMVDAMTDPCAGRCEPTGMCINLCSGNNP